jgi:hypothetical protein
MIKKFLKPSGWEAFFIVYGLWFKGIAPLLEQKALQCIPTELQKHRTWCFSGIPEAKKEAVSKESLTQIKGKAGRH